MTKITTTILTMLKNAKKIAISTVYLSEKDETKLPLGNSDSDYSILINMHTVPIVKENGTQLLQRHGTYKDLIILESIFARMFLFFASTIRWQSAANKK